MMHLKAFPALATSPSAWEAQDHELGTTSGEASFPGAFGWLRIDLYRAFPMGTLAGGMQVNP